MQDLTQGSITRHLLNMAVFIGMGLVFQTLYFIVDLYFVSRLGADAIAGVGAAGNAMFLTMAISQLVAVGALALVAQAAGRKDHGDANLVFNQAVSLGILLGLITLAVGYTVADKALSLLAAGPEAAAQGRAYLFGFLPNLALAFPMAAVGSALRATGVVRSPMLIQSLAVILNVILAPILIAGWGTGVPLGVFGAGLASSISAGVGFVVLVLIFHRVQSLIRTHPREWIPRLAIWRRIVGIGVPAAGEFFLMFLIFTVIYWVIRHFGPEAQAGFGIGGRLMMSIYLPAMAIGFAAAPIAGQNYGAGKFDRVRLAFSRAMLIGGGVMLALTAVCQWRADLFVAPFTDDPAVAEVAVTYLKFISVNFVAAGVVLACSGIFQALGDTRPSFLASASRIFTFALPAIWWSTQPGMQIEHVWVLSVASTTIQAILAYWLVRRLMKKKLAGPPPVPMTASAA